VAGSVSGAAERRRAGRVGELDGEGFEERSAGVGRDDTVQLLNRPLRLISPVEPNETDALRQPCNATKSPVSAQSMNHKKVSKFDNI